MKSDLNFAKVSKETPLFDAILTLLSCKLLESRIVNEGSLRIFYEEQLRMLRFSEPNVVRKVGQSRTKLGQFFAQSRLIRLATFLER